MVRDATPPAATLPSLISETKYTEAATECHGRSVLRDVGLRVARYSARPPLQQPMRLTFLIPLLLAPILEATHAQCATDIRSLLVTRRLIVARAALDAQLARNRHQ